MNKLNVLTILAMTAALAASAQVDIHMNPATYSAVEETQFTSVSVGFSHKMADEAEKMELGRGHNLADITVRTVRNLKGGGVAWGGASFTTGRLRDIRFNSAADYLRVEPYVVGDSVGGSRSMQQYTFSGGYSHRIGSRTTLGAEMDYRADIEYRNRDPRVKNVVSDFCLKAGLTQGVSADYKVGANVGLLIYNQESNIDFYNPMNDIFEHVNTGAGTTYARFYGSTSQSAYKGLGFTSGLQFFPTKAPRPFDITASVRFDFTDMDFILRDYNDLTLSNADDYRVVSDLSAKIEAGIVTFRPAAQFGWTRRIATENIFGTASGNSYPLLGSRQFFMTERSSFAAALPVVFSAGESLRFTLAPTVARAVVHGHYRLPERDFKVAHLTSGASLAIDKYFGKSRLQLKGGATYTDADILNRHFVGLDVRKGPHYAIDHNFRMLSSDRLNINAGLNADIPVAKKAQFIFVGVDYSHKKVHNHGHINEVAARVGYRF